MKFAAPLRVGLVMVGAILIALVLGARVVGMHAGGTMGPAQRQVLVLGLLALVAGIMPAPSRLLAGVLDRAAAADAPRVAPLTLRTIATLAGIVLIAFAFRGVMIRTYWPQQPMLSGMTLWDAEMARNLLNGRGWMVNWSFVQRLDRAVVARQAMVDPQDFLPADDERPGALAPLAFFAHTPGYSLWLAASFAIGHGLRLAYSQWMQAALDASATLLVFGIGRRLWSPTAGLVGALVYALSPAHVYVAIQTLAASTDSFWALLIAYGLVRVWTDREQRPFPLVGIGCIVVATACETAINSYMFWMPVIAAAWALALGLVAVPAMRRLAVPLLVAQVAVVVVLTPWALRNHRVYGQLAYTRQQFWEFVWELPIGNVPNPWGMTFGNNDEAYARWIAARCPNCTPIEREDATRRFLLSDVLPSKQFAPLFVRAMLKRLPAFVYASRLPVDKPFVASGSAGRAFSLALRVLNVAALLFWPLAAIGLAAVTLRTGAPAAWIALAPTVFLIAFSLIFMAEHRKTTPAYGYLMALSGVGVTACLERPRVRAGVAV